MIYFGSKVSNNQLRTPEGYLICKNCIIGKEGSLSYLDRELNIGDSGKIIKVYRTKEENNDKATLASFEGKPVTEGHPYDDVDSSNWNYYMKGHAQNIRVGTLGNNTSCIVADLVIYDDMLINKILSGELRELSCGYDTKYISDGNNLFQTEIRGNHIAIVKDGRAGNEVSIRDSMPSEILNKLKGESMPNTNKFKQALTDFAQKCNKVRTIDEMNDLIDNCAGTLEEVVKEENKDHIPETVQVPTANPTPEQPAQPAQGSNEAMASIMSAIQALEQKVDALANAGQSTPEEDIDNAINSLESGDNTKTDDENPVEEFDNGVTSDKTPANPEDCTAVDSDDDMDNDYEVERIEEAVRDGKLAMLKSMKKTISEIKDPEIKRKMTDSLLASIKLKPNKNQNSIKNIQKLKAKDSSVESEEKKLKDIQDRYASMNPHLSKKYNLGK